MAKTRGRPFQKGNPGRPVGSKNKSTIALQSILGERGDAIMEKAVELALAGNPMALRLCVEHLLGSRTERSVTIELEPIHTAADAAKALSAIVTAAGSGQISPREAADLSNIVSLTAKALEATQIEERLRKLEGKYE